MKQKLLFIFLFACLIGRAQGPVWQWANTANGTGAENAISVAADASGNSFATGYFYSPSLAFGSTLLTNNGNYDLYLVKYDAAGNVLWAKGAGGAYDDVANGITCDGSGNVIITGYFTSSTIAFGSFTLNNSGGEDIFIVKYDASGNVLWARSAGGSNIDEGYEVSADESGNVYVAGQFQSASFAFGTTTLSSTGIGDALVLKYSSAGSPLWARSYGGSQLDIAYGLKADAAGAISLCGSFKSDTMLFGSYKLANASPGTNDIFMARIDNSGNTLWALSAGGATDDMAYGTVIDGSGDFYFTGTFKSTALALSTGTLTNAGAGSCDVFIAKCNAAGGMLWARSAGGSFDDISYGVGCDALGNAYITGHLHSSTLTFGSYTLTNSSAGNGDIFVAGYNSNGSVLTALSAGGMADDGSSGLAVDAAGDVFVSGYYNSNAISFGSNMLSNSGNADMVVAKLSSALFIGDNELPDNVASVYPNPSAGIFFVKGIKEIRGITVLNSLGEPVLKTPLDENASIDLSHYPQGIYYLEIISEKGILRKKIVRG